MVNQSITKQEFGKFPCYPLRGQFTKLIHIQQKQLGRLILSELEYEQVTLKHAAQVSLEYHRWLSNGHNQYHGKVSGKA